MQRIGAFLSMALLFGCTSYRLDVGTVCDSSQMAFTEDPEMQKSSGDRHLEFYLEWAERNVHTPEGKLLVGSIRTQSEPYDVRARALRQAATRVGRRSCPLADWMDQSLRSR